jgi:LmbE family N-acetylglucosaminyl deacetylase
MARFARLGADWTVVTVFAGRPDATQPASRYDQRCGFRSAGEAAAVRRSEDERACAIVGATAVWLPFEDSQYQQVRDANAVWAALEPHLSRAELLLVPGFPLAHRDHAWVSELVINRVSTNARVALYAEQPYAGIVPRVADAQPFAAGCRVRWVRLRCGISDRLAKGMACRAYWSQFRTFGCRLPLRLLLPELFWTAERLGWPDGRHLQG